MLCERSHKHSSATATCSGKKPIRFRKGKINSVSDWSRSSANSHTWALTCVLTTSGFISSDAKPSDAESTRRLTMGTCALVLCLGTRQNAENVSVKLYSGTGHKENIGTGLQVMHQLWEDLKSDFNPHNSWSHALRLCVSAMHLHGKMAQQHFAYQRSSHHPTRQCWQNQTWLHLTNRRRNGNRAMQKHNNSRVLIKVAFPCNTNNLGKKQTTLKKCYNHATCLKLLRYQNITGAPMEP